MFMATCHLRTRERVKGNTAFPFTIPAAPQRNRCFALRSPPAPLPAVGLTRRPVSTNLSPPSLAACPCHRVFVSPISAGTQLPRCTLCARGGTKMSLRLACGKMSQPWLKRLKTFTVSTVQNGLARQAFIGAALTGCTKCSSLACNISRGVRAVPGSVRPPYRSQPRIG
ncbi:hypothetical protein PHDIMM138B_25655 [Phytobacter diazotrophicus]